MKRLILVLIFVLALAAAAVAQDKSQSQPPAPQPLTPQQVQQLAEAEKTLSVAQAEATAAQERVAKIQAQIQSLVKTFFIENGVDGKKYDSQLKLIDERAGTIGFLPKSPPAPQSAAKRED
ncbi:MAG TPA: hypothetical protein PLD20_01025 [Blastocatellia bacterium]|nr:hypothetical protein [Blastocatellia bacterium]HMV81830.1 hypothetical protein [Blastocatellia bacterium]HMX23989.1 hypothetical protein [Blastocatellia bacterium]HMY70740.1 hypothetical protein [Blastocatellia bacterium]HMZ16518.1 hypothetical protein [Blastocatellia bacterium]